MRGVSSGKSAASRRNRRRRLSAYFLGVAGAVLENDRRSHVYVRTLVCLSAMVVVAGCGDSRDPNRPRTVPVSVTVTYQGQPVSAATVTFHPAGSQARGATTLTDEEGHAEMWAFEPGDGVIPGDYRVTVSKVAISSLPDRDSVSPEEYEKAERKLAKERPKHELPVKYSQAKKSPLTISVSEDGDREFSLDLAD